MIPITPNRSRGFSLLEVMVALVIISIGLLGIGALQASAFVNTHASQTESVVAIEARSLADAMEANPGYWKSVPASTIAVASSTLSDATLQASPIGCVQAICTATQMAASDLKQWGTDLNTQVPGATGQVTCQIGAPVICTIQVTWQPKATVAISKGTQSSTTALPTNLTYTLVNQL